VKPTHFNVKIPVKAYIWKYLAARYGFPLEVKASTSFGDIVLTKLKDTTKTKLSSYDLNIKLRSYNSVLRVLIPWDYLYRINQELSPSVIVRLNNFFENQFREELHRYVQALTDTGETVKEAIEKFAEKYGIELDEDVSFDCLKKMEYRDRIAVKTASQIPDAVKADISYLSNVVRRFQQATGRNQLSLF